MEEKDTRQDYCAPEQESERIYKRPVYETAEEYNQANRETGNYNPYDNQTYESKQYTNDNSFNGNIQHENQQYGNQQYGSSSYRNSQYANLGGIIVDADGNPLKNRFAVQLVFAIIEILCCCFSPIVMVLGIIALVFTIQANTAFHQGRAEEFKAKSKVSNILLIIGGVFAAIALIINIIFVSLFMAPFKDIFSELQNEIRNELENEGNWNDLYTDDEDLNDEVYEEYPGTNEVPLTEGFENFTYNGTAYSVPMTYQEFMTMGYVLEEGYENMILDAESWESIWFCDETGAIVGSIRISNDTQNEMPLEEGMVDYIYFDNPASYTVGVDNIDLVFGNGFDMSTTYEELEAWLGTPYYINVDRSGGSDYASYEWTYQGEDTYQSIVINFLDGVITDIAFEQYDFVN